LPPLHLMLTTFSCFSRTTRACSFSGS
jgi:hypothetical protein